MADATRQKRQDIVRDTGWVKTATNEGVADGVGFEPTRSLHPCRFSRPVPSTARPPIHQREINSLLRIRTERNVNTCHRGTQPGPNMAAIAVGVHSAFRVLMVKSDGRKPVSRFFAALRRMIRPRGQT
jgi:hypothetical protein